MMLLPDATLQQSRSFLEIELRKVYSGGEAASITRLILEHVGYPYSTLLMEPSLRPGSKIVAQIKEIVADIHTGRPIQYILGHTYFFDLKITLTDQVLIPRPETEEMIHHIIRDHQQAPSRIVDLGTGSGCIALALKKVYPEATVTGADKNIQALKVAERNSLVNQLLVSWIEWDMLRGLSGELPDEIDLLVSNPPYVRKKERRLMQDHVLNFEPGEALFVSDEEPLIFYSAIASLGREHLSKQGIIWVEINETLAEETAGVFESAGYHHIHILKDIHDKNRFIRATR
jgi:release factor glutamine methyltransferase